MKYIFIYDKFELKHLFLEVIVTVLIIPPPFVLWMA